MMMVIMKVMVMMKVVQVLAPLAHGGSELLAEMLTEMLA